MGRAGVFHWEARNVGQAHSCEVGAWAGGEAEDEAEYKWPSGWETVSFSESGPTRQAPQYSIYIPSINPARNYLQLEDTRAELLYFVSSVTR